VLGKHLKYSSAYYPHPGAPPAENLDAAEARMLALTCERARLEDGDRILELGCGWGSLSLWMAANYPNSRITAVSNSRTQKAHIDGQARERGLANLEIVTCDVNTLSFPPETRFDRVVSVEMFEHMRNWRELFARVHDWLEPGGRFFGHVFVHRSVPYLFERRGESDWMSEHFFSGGMMPSDDLALRFQQHLALLHRWRWNGTHYARTANAWLANLDTNRERALAVLASVHGAHEAAQWLQRWRMFFMACAELFGFDGGRQWFVSHYLFERPASRAR
jgi:cyclopropane-fatty-acyl-phospholipid synthase